MLTTTQVGPITTPPQYDKILDYIGIAKKEGASCVLGGGPAIGPDVGKGGYFIEPTIFTGVNNRMRIAREEVFGPVLAATVFDDEDQAVALANATEYGLIAAVWTSSLDTANRMARDVRAGQVYVNTYGAGGGVEFPFGGFKKSGYGREKGFDALAEVCQTKTVVMKVPR